MDTHWLLFISKSHTGTLSPHSTQGGKASHVTIPIFMGLCCAPRDVPNPVPKGTFSTPKSHCPRSPRASKDTEYQWKELTVEALLAHSPAFFPHLELEKRFCSLDRSYFPPSIY